MNLPPLGETKPQGEPQQVTQDPSKTGQPGTTEETTAQGAVTLSPQLTALARKQQRLQQEIQAQRDKESEWAKKEADYVPKSSIKAKAQQNAVEALADIGLTYEELTNLLLSQQQGDDPIQGTVKALQAEIQQIKSTQEQNVSKQYEATVAQYRGEIDSLIASDDAFITIREEGRADAVLQHILDTFEEDPSKVLTVEQASKEIEEFLVEEAEKKLSLTKVKAKLTPQETKPAEKTLPPTKAAPPRTLTQQVETTPTRTYNQFQHLSMKERIAHAVARARK
jgi:vacuolar-type H+-ATPase subunit I/STV1